MKETAKSRAMVQRYPVLANVPPELRQPMIRKAVMHPATLLFAAVCGLLVLPYYLDYVMGYLGFGSGNETSMMLVKLFVVAAVPFFLMFFFLSRYLIPWCLGRIVKKAGFLPPEDDRG